MKIQRKVICVLGVLFAVLGAAQFVVQERILLPGFAELEREAARTDMDRVSNTIKRELDLLSITARDYANWIDTYQFMQDHNPAYVTTNLTDDSIKTLRVNVMAFIAPDGHYMWVTGRQLETAEALNVDLVAGPGLPAEHPWRAAVRNGTTTSGVLTTNQGAILAVIAPILDGSGQGPNRGMLLLGRLVTDQELARIGEQAQVSLSKVALNLTGARPVLQSETLIERDTVTEVLRPIRDVNGAPALLLRIEVPRTISAKGLEVAVSGSLFMIGAGAIVLVLMVLVLNRTVLSPLATVTRHAVTLAQSDDLTSRLDLKRVDELGDLAREFDHMVGRLAEARRQLIDQSFDAGIAENASGVLHNIGNAMTPLGVQVSGLQQSLRAAPTGDIELVLAELARGGADSARKADLEEFLKLTSRELATVVSGALREIETVTRQTQAIQNALADQTQHTRGGKVIEAVRLPDLIEQSAELVAPELRQLLSIEHDTSLHDLGAVRVSRTVLQQVFQNLIVNAAEAVRDAGRKHGSLRVSVTVVPTSTGEQMDLRFTDNGVGMSADQLSRIFEKNFSTKSRMGNRGIGLHWGANTLNALGGALRAESPGPNCGSSLHVIVPLERAASFAMKQVA